MRRNGRRRNDSLIADILKGAAAGAAATWAMDRVTTVLHEREDPKARRREKRARQGKTAYELAVEKMAGLAGRKLTADRRNTLGSALHWAAGIMAGINLALMRRRVPFVHAGHGLLFGSLFWLLIDELANPLIGIARGPRAFPWQTHARGLAGHLAFGMAADGTLHALERVT